jgi:hypothetical protein
MLLAHLLLHAGERVVGSRQVARQVGKGLLHQALHLNPLIPAGKLDEFLDYDPNSEIHLMRSLIPIQAISECDSGLAKIKVFTKERNG